MSDFKPTAWVKTTCPFSFKFRLFATEAGLHDRFEFVAMNPMEEGFAAAKADLEARSGGPVVFPTVEVAPGEFQNDSDALIERYAGENGIDPGSLPTLQFYLGGLFPTILDLFDYSAGPLPWLIHLGRRPLAFR